MAKHELHAELPSRKIGKADVIFRVKTDGSTFGTLKVSQGSVVWYPRGRSKGCKMGWKRFDAIMKEHATRMEKR